MASVFRISRYAQVAASGVVEFDNAGGLRCNDEDMISILSDVVNDIRPKRDYYGKFAAKISINLEITGDLDTRGAEDG